MKFNYICNCHKPQLKFEYSYWEDKNTTSDEMDIINYLSKNENLKNKKILHIGIGNSFLFDKFSLTNKVYGLSISKKEIFKAKKKGGENYKVFFCDKYSINFELLFKENNFDIIVDTNLKSYSCCEKSFNFMLKNYIKKLAKNGMIITSRRGMSWYKKLQPKLSFNLRKMFHYKFKEISGNKSNILSINDMKNFSKLYSLDIFYDNKICFLKK